MSLHRPLGSRFVFALLLAIFGSTSLFAQCTLSTTNPSVTICSPANNATVSSPVNVVAGTTDSNNVTKMEIYLDGVGVYGVAANHLNASIPINSTGSHRIAVQAWDSAGQVFKSVIYVTV